MLQYPYPLFLYTKEAKYRLLYILTSFLLSFILFFYFSNVFLVFETYPLLRYFRKTFVSLQILEVFNSLIRLSFLNTLIIVYPLFCYNLLLFLYPSYYFFQIHILKNYLIGLFLLFFLCKLVFYTSILPSILYFFVDLNLNNYFISLLNLKFEANIYLYLLLISSLCNYFCMFSVMLFCFFIFLLFFVNPKIFFIRIKKQKNLFLFFILTMFSIFIPSDFILQFFCFFYVVILIEILFFFSCFKLKQHESSLVA